MTPTCLSDMDGLTYPTMNGSMDNLVAGPNPTPVVPVIPTTTDPGWSQVSADLADPQPYIFLRSYRSSWYCSAVTLRHHFSNWSLVPLLALATGCGRIYTPCISVFLSCISKIPNLSQTAPSHYLIAVWLLGWVRQCNVAAAVVNVIATEHYAMVTLSLHPKMCKSFLSFAPISPQISGKGNQIMTNNKILIKWIWMCANYFWKLRELLT